MKQITKVLFSLLVIAGLVSCNAKGSHSKNEETPEIAPKLMWIDATANIERFNNKDTIDLYLTKLKELGFTDIVVDIRPICGHVLYESVYAPLLTEWKGKEIKYGFDYLGYYIEKSHELGLKVQASLNTFVAGHNYMDDGIIYKGGKAEWASTVYPPSEEVKFIPITEEKHKYSELVNIVGGTFQEYILNIFREVVVKYPKLDGIILDRVRFDGFTADFSELSRAKFEEYLGQRLDQFPDDIYRWKKDENGKFYPEQGKHFLKWLEWRASVIYSFMAKAKNIVKEANPSISFGTYTGAWYPSYFEVGVNFASKNYDPSADFEWATADYKNYGYAELLDIFTVGNYYTTITMESYVKENPEVKNETDMWAQKSIWYCVEGSNQHLKQILDGNKFYGGILADQFYTNPQGLTESIKMNLASSDGLMIFDIVHIIEKNMWEYVEKGMRESGAI